MISDAQTDVGRAGRCFSNVWQKMFAFSIKLFKVGIILGHRCSATPAFICLNEDLC